MAKQKQNKTYTAKQGKFSARKTNAGIVITDHTGGVAKKTYVYPKTRPKRPAPCGYRKKVRESVPARFGKSIGGMLLDCQRKYKKRSSQPKVKRRPTRGGH